MEQTLLEKAKQTQRNNRRPVPTDEMVELVIAWYNNEVSNRQFFHAISQPKNRNPYEIALILRDAVRDKKAKVEKV